MRAIAITILLSLLATPGWAERRIRFDPIDPEMLPREARHRMDQMQRILQGTLNEIPRSYRQKMNQHNTHYLSTHKQVEPQDLAGPQTPNFVVMFTNASGPHALFPKEQHRIHVYGDQPLFTKSAAHKMGLEPNHLYVEGGWMLEAIGLFPTAGHVPGISAWRFALEKGNRHTVYLLEPDQRWLQGMSQYNSDVLVEEVPNNGRMVTPVAFTIQFRQPGEHRLMFDPYPTQTQGPAASFATRSMILDVK